MQRVARGNGYTSRKQRRLIVAGCRYVTRPRSTTKHPAANFSHRRVYVQGGLLQTRVFLILIIFFFFLEM